MYGYFACSICLCNTCTQGQMSREPEEAVRSPGSGVTTICEQWEFNSGPLEEQSVLVTTDPSIQPQVQDSQRWHPFRCRPLPAYRPPSLLDITLGSNSAELPIQPPGSTLHSTSPPCAFGSPSQRRLPFPGWLPPTSFSFRLSSSLSRLVVARGQGKRE